MEELQARNFLMVTGSSGDGKSSLVFAGLLPNIRGGFFKAKYLKWKTVIFRPGIDPQGNFSNSLAPVLNLTPDQTESALSFGYSALADLYKKSDAYDPGEGTLSNVNPDETSPGQKKSRSKKGSNLLIVIDQFEEFFTHSENYENDSSSPSIRAQLTINLIIESAKISKAEGLPIYILCTMRSDFFGQIASFRGLPELVGENQFFVPRLNHYELQQIIKDPAELNGNTITERLVERLINDIDVINMDVLPMLQHALRRIWFAAEKGNKALDLIHYAMAGGMKKSELPVEDQEQFDQWFQTLSLSKQAQFNDPKFTNVLNLHAGELFKAAGDNQVLIEKVFKCLVKSDNNRVVRNSMTISKILEMIGIEDLTADKLSFIIADFRSLNNSFIYPFITKADMVRLLSVGETDNNENRDQLLDITHEALIRNWTLLRTWAEEEENSTGIYGELHAQMCRWHQNDKSNNQLLASGTFHYFSSWFESANPSNAWLLRFQPYVGIGNTENGSIQVQITEFLNRSKVAVKKSERAKAVTYTVISALVLAIVGLFYVFNLKNEIELTAKSNSIATKAYTTLEHDPTLAFRLAEAAYNISPTPMASQVVMAAYAEMPFYMKLEGHKDPVYYATWSPDGNYIVTASSDNSALIMKRNGGIKATMIHNGALQFQTETVIFSPDGQSLLTCAKDSTSRLWNLEGKQLVRLKHDHALVMSNFFSDDGSLILTASYDSTARVWDRTGSEILRMKHRRRVLKALFIPGTKRVITLAGSIVLWDETGKKIKEIKTGQDFTQISVSHNGEIIMGGDKKGCLYAFNNKGKVIFSENHHEGKIMYIDFSPDDEYIVVADGSGLISLWNNMGEFLANLRGHKSSIWQVKFSPDGKKIASCSDDGTAKIWNLDGSDLMTLKGHTSQILSVNWSPDGKKVITASADYTARVWEVEPAENPLLLGHTGYVMDAQFSIEGTRIITAGWDLTARLWDNAGRESNKIVHPNICVFQALFSSNKEIYTSNGNSGFMIRFNCLGFPMDTFKHKDGLPDFGMEISQDAGKIVTQDKANNAFLWDTSGFLIQKFERQCLQFISGNYSTLLTIAKDSSIYFWKQAPGEDSLRFEKFIQLTIPGSSFKEAKISKDEKWMATISEDSTIRTWNLEEILSVGTENKKDKVIKLGLEKVGPKIKLNSLVASLIFSPNATIFLSNSMDNIIRLWDMKGNQKSVMKGHSDIISDVNFSPDGKYIVSGSNDKTVRLWDLTGKELMVYSGHKGAVTKAKFSPNGKYILSSSLDHTARLMPISVETVLNKINKEKVRGDVWEMSETELEVYGIK